MKLARFTIAFPLFVGIAMAWLDASANPGQWRFYVLQDMLVYALGCQLLGAGIGHLFFSRKIAEYIGWQSGPFQFEVGIADIGMGVLGIMCGYFAGIFWFATIVMASIFLWGTAIGHIREMIRKKNFAPGNAGYMFWFGLCIPPLLIYLYASM